MAASTTKVVSANVLTLLKADDQRIRNCSNDVFHAPIMTEKSCTLPLRFPEIAADTGPRPQIFCDCNKDYRKLTVD